MKYQFIHYTILNFAIFSTTYLASSYFATVVVVLSSFRKIQHSLSIPPLWVKHSVIIQIVISKGAYPQAREGMKRGVQIF